MRAAALSAAVTPVKRMVRSTVPPRTVADRTTTGADLAASFVRTCQPYPAAIATSARNENHTKARLQPGRGGGPARAILSGATAGSIGKGMGAGARLILYRGQNHTVPHPRPNSPCRRVAGRNPPSTGARSHTSGAL